ncbi:MAG TPA: MBL fold metallo-hydrolase [Thermoguttaceae bacterium]|nr:MBL fold metallo-hydrolase [Thermoguttaceae bacterium]
MRLQFLGAARQVTGSRYYLEANGSRLLIDCGMFQERDFQDRNWEPSVIGPRRIDAVLLTHAHVDHCGLLPKLVGEGFRGKIYATPATADLVDIVLRDAAKIQEEDAAFKQKRHRREGRRGRWPVKPLFTEQEVERTLPLLRSARYGEPVEVGKGVTATFHDAGHILGSAMLELTVRENDQTRRIIFSGDVGQWDKPIIRDPSVFTQADYVVMESTYGIRKHEDFENVETRLARIISETVAAGGNVVIPTFAIERAQELIYHLGGLLHEGRIPAVPVYLDSPMASEVTGVFQRHHECFDEETWRRLGDGGSPLKFPGLRMVQATEDSKAINWVNTPVVIMATSGMCTAGRIKHHLVHNITRPESTLLFVGYQATGTLGRQILEKPAEVRIHGRLWPLRARVEHLDGFSGHADCPGLMRWLGYFKEAPRTLFLTHGEEEASLGLARKIKEEKGWTVTVPHYQQTVELE